MKVHRKECLGDSANEEKFQKSKCIFNQSFIVNGMQVLHA